MLVLNRKQGQRVIIGDDIEVTVLKVQGNQVKLGIRGPEEIPIHREEIHLKLSDCDPLDNCQTMPSQS
ncbi:MAG: carbon storage regulator CsrA [Thermoguttaceae bacterium]|jgi:carbon storage regulator